MKAINKFFLTPILTLFLCSTALAANSTESNPRANQTEQYAMVIASGKMLSLTQWKVEVDFGQELQIGIRNKDLLRDDEGKVIPFNSPMDALNYMNSQGWVLVSANASDSRFTAIIKREVPKRDVE